MLSLNIPVNTSLDKIREKFNDRNNRDDLTDMRHYHLIGRKTIQNMKNKIFDSTVTRHSDNDTSTFLRVEELQKERMIFKQQNVEDKIYGLGKEDFMLAVMTKQQLLMYRMRNLHL